MCFSTADYSLRCPASAGSFPFQNASSDFDDSLTPTERVAYDETVVAAKVGVFLYAVGVPLTFLLLLLYCRLLYCRLLYCGLLGRCCILHNNMENKVSKFAPILT